MGGAAVLMPVLGTGLVGAAALVFISGVAFGMMPISVQTWMLRAAPEAMESGSAVFVATTQVSVASGALVGGVLVDHFGCQYRDGCWRPVRHRHGSSNRSLG